MNIAKILDKIGVREINGNLNKSAEGISYDSRRIEKGTMFFAVKGQHSDGHAYIKEAIKKGAHSVIYEDEIDVDAFSSKDILLVRVDNVRRALAYIAARYYGDPSKELRLTGVTGTNGKTSTCYLMRSILTAYGKKSGMIGTIQYLVGDTVYSAHHTTPEAPEFQMYLNIMLEQGCEYAVSEISSHALAQYRVDAAEFDVVVFTNLTRDHLDYHKDMNDYFNSKKRLFNELLKPGGISVINADDEFGQELIKEMLPEVISYGMDSRADVRAVNIKRFANGLDFDISYAGTEFNIVSNLRGYVNIYNILAAFSASTALGIPYEAIISGISKLKSVRGRFEPVDCGQDFSVIVDYAHTDDALHNVIDSMKKLSSGRIITVFGCGGNRDTGKRPIMGRIASTLSDYTIVTSDNPRYEEPGDIIRQILEGIEGSSYAVEPDRKNAIKMAVNMAAPGDVVLIAGKGHENYQDIKGVRHPFDDRELAEKFILKRLKHSDRPAEAPR
ncbi:UDP-N-acetylmuramoyl-L-alanyl-D-glutamate--2,6-diaminopimelate ligase [Candidatus Magnetominusculus xianensis]|uniref:UDP-N-acetylmuramoyl-L-alanyl-D-glutamate--2,6-diaminopimelate ligase n=1 Tax=Candidatus Magnetominusculus xianensis TaxID=1748249 RepID=A0ABR5SGI6_9BACT|nr:UDP-N-acetylmuramoyl-L-alanyl-D-glutamate--2,6-diaminopimelate ligase [Candidatus Magnetominusculus xianensis]KWT89802.1 UDP-N-acetylmuramoyl-L-alanyl-D-glutamate--2,6-diaminopimelate ligase [Candidatus Magnetominusculus xianensis]MBF0404589.1 UDP-N-acetylmuramoyl-L-alanyl-D-glutamate--2,6-diaminopimelate ligase [Nitrospirota bacterium]